ncbi:hypothetical protein ACA30_08765 [Virgibacillus soli]|uniref:Uncharacterized protein n=1 Tax=Lederbergia galactosidilytica TaxID=217031 RepID=A0A0Q9Y8K1_9BACI|nr:hypothetical protein ACA29_11470 [Lederbergia galactosidilytica]KRG15234.1 hypothetical protein ACA30_08765 [Virgibacillus soli]
MHKILFLPFLQIPSGHHHVADRIKIQLEQMSEAFIYSILQFGNMEDVQQESLGLDRKNCGDHVIDFNQYNFWRVSRLYGE